MGFFDSVLGAKQPQPSSLPQLSQPKRILVVIADDALRNQFTQLLLAEKFIVVAVNNGAEGLNMVITYQPEIILLELTLPIMDGKTMLHSLRALPQFKKTPVVVLSDTGDIETMRQVKTFDSANAFLIKANTNTQEVIENVKMFI